MSRPRRSPALRAAGILREPSAAARSTTGASISVKRLRSWRPDAEGPHYPLSRRARGPCCQRGNFVDLRDAGDPVEQARLYDKAGADELTFLDITASHEARDTIYDVVARTAEEVFMPLTVGGGVRTVDDIRVLLAGADKVSINTAAVHRPKFVAEAAARFGSQCIVVAIDAKSTGRASGKSSPMAGGTRPGSMRSNGQIAWPPMRANCC